MDQQPIHGNIARLRKAKGLSQSQLAALLGVDETAVSHWERGINSPKGTRLTHLADIFGVAVDDLLRKELADDQTPSAAPEAV
jgi:transcriptional regulator with XRE-family HTH domain